MLTGFRANEMCPLIFPDGLVNLGIVGTGRDWLSRRRGRW